MKAYIADSETTGHFKDDAPPQVIQLAFAELTTKFEISGKASVEFFKPSCPITPGARAVHHIVDDDLLGARPSSEAKLPEDCFYLAGHNIDYDWKALGSPPRVKRICTLAMARRVWEEEPDHSLGACLYRILPQKEARARLKGAHDALVDIENTYLLLKYFIDQQQDMIETFEDLYLWSEKCRIPRIWTFGKHRGKRIGHEFGHMRPDRGYHTWCLGQMDMDPYVHKAIVRFREGTL